MNINEYNNRLVALGIRIECLVEIELDRIQRISVETTGKYLGIYGLSVLF